MTIAFTFGPWGGFYCHWGYTKRLCLGWVAITFFPVDIDALLQDSESVVKTIVDYMKGLDDA